MKGLAFRWIVLIILALIVIAVALIFLNQLPSLEELFMSPDQRILVKYSTCSLAYCASGAGSDQVKKVGCLKTDEFGKCVMTCEDVEEKTFKPIIEAQKGVTGFQTGGNTRYCGRDFELNFEFTGSGLGGVVPLKSGQMDSVLAKQPQWVCKPMKLPFTNVEIDEYQRYTPSPAFLKLTTSDSQYDGNFLGIFNFEKNCIMLSKSVPDSVTYANTITFIINFIPVVGQIDDAAKVGIRGITSAKKAFSVAVSRAGKSAYLYRAPKAFVKAFKQSTKPAAGIGTALETSTAGGLISSFAVGSSDLNDPHRSRGMLTKGGCFTGYVYDFTEDEYESRLDILYSPILQYYDTPEGKNVKIYPSAMYVDDSFVQSGECELEDEELAKLKQRLDAGEDKNKILAEYMEEYENAHKDDPEYQNSNYDGDKILDPRSRGHVSIGIGDYLLSEDAAAYANSKFSRGSLSGIDVYGTSVFAGEVGFDFGNVVKSCNFKALDSGRRIQYSIWSNPTYPGAGTAKAAETLGGDLSSGLGALVGLQDDSSSKISESVKDESFLEFLGKINEIDSKLSEYANVKLLRDELEKKGAEATEEEKIKLTEAQERLDSLSLEMSDIVDQYAAQYKLTPQERDDLFKTLERDPEEFKRKIGRDPSEKSSTDDWHAKFGSCAYVTLGREGGRTGIDLPGSQPVDTSLKFTKPEGGEMAKEDASETGISAVSDSGKLHAFYQTTGGQAFEDDSSDIIHATSDDGKTWTVEPFVSGGGVKTAEPSAATSASGIYVAYAKRGTSSDDIFVKKVGGEESVVISDDLEQGSPSLVVMNEKFYLFYHQKINVGRNDETYRIFYVEGEEKDGKVQWSAPKRPSEVNGEGSSTSQSPSATAAGGRIILAYVHSENPLNRDKLESGIEKTLRPFTIEFDGSAFSNRASVVSGSEAVRGGNPRVVETSGSTYVFYDSGGEDGYSDPDNFVSRIVYKRQVGDVWETYAQDPFLSLFGTEDYPDNAVQPEPVAVNGKLVLLFSQFTKPQGKTGTWDVLTSAQEEKLSVSGVDVSTDKGEYATGETIKVSGKLTPATGDPSGQKVKVMFYYYNPGSEPDGSGEGANVMVKPILEALTDEAGAFSAETASIVAESYYSIQAESGETKSEHHVFKVTK